MTDSGSAVCKEDTKRTRKRKCHHDEIGTAEDANLRGGDKLRVTVFLPIIDNHCFVFHQCIGAYSTL